MVSWDSHDIVTGPMVDLTWRNKVNQQFIWIPRIMCCQVMRLIELSRLRLSIVATPAPILSPVCIEHRSSLSLEVSSEEKLTHYLCYFEPFCLYDSSTSCIATAQSRLDHSCLRSSSKLRASHIYLHTGVCSCVAAYCKCWIQSPPNLSFSTVFFTIQSVLPLST